MKFVGVENNTIHTSIGSLIVSDQPIKKYSYYFELEAGMKFKFNAAAVAFVEKDENNEFLLDNHIREYGQYSSSNDYNQNFTDIHNITRQYYQNSLNLELSSAIGSNLCELSIIDDKNNFIHSSINSGYSYFTTNYYGTITTFYRLGLSINIDPDKKITTIKYYSDKNDKNVNLLSQLSINKIFDPNRLYLVIYPQYISEKTYGYVNTQGYVTSTTYITNYASYKFFFNKDEIKYTHLYEKYNHPATVVEKLGGGGVWQNE